MQRRRCWLDYAGDMPSTTRPTPNPVPRLRSAPEEVTLLDWPLRERPIGSLLALAAVVAAAGLAGWVTANWVTGVVVGAILTVTMWRTWLPVRYELTGSGIRQSVLGWTRRVPWAAVRQFELRADGALLSPDSVLEPLTPLRGFYLHWGQQREAVVAHLEYYVISIIPPATNRDSKIA